MALIRRKHKPTTPTTVTPSSVSPVVAVINASTVMTDEQIAPIVAALQIQCDRDFGPIWGVTCRLMQISKGQAAPPNDWQLIVADDSDQAGALGYHSDTSQGKPVAFVFAKTDLDYGAKVSVTISHECLEFLADGGCNLSSQNSDNTFWAYEACDAVEDDSLGYDINGVTVSDFVTPFYFQAQPPSGAKFDFQGILPGPFTLATGGYANVWDGSSWTQQANGQVVPSRFEKR